jgi:uncharacterized membrane protein
VLTQALGVAAVVGSGVVAGVLFSVALTTVPALLAMPVDRYVYTHKRIGVNFDPTMPILVLGSMVLDAVLAGTAGTAPARVLWGTGAVLLLGVSGVSHLCNVPINRRIRALDADEPPPGWRDPRPVWRAWHLLRTALSALALVAGAIASASAI